MDCVHQNQFEQQDGLHMFSSKELLHPSNKTLLSLRPLLMHQRYDKKQDMTLSNYVSLGTKSKKHITECRHITLPIMIASGIKGIHKENWNGP